MTIPQGKKSHTSDYKTNRVEDQDRTKWIIKRTTNINKYINLTTKRFITEF